MKKYASLLRVVAIILALSFASVWTTSCSKKDDENKETVYYKVVFDPANGEATSQTEVAEGSRLTPPLSPEKDNYIFIGWEYNKQIWDFEIHSVKENTTLTAMWVSASSVFSYQHIEDTETVMITGIKETPDIKVLNIPSIINGYTLTAIGDGAFASFQSDTLSTIVLPSSVNYVGDYAFEDFPINLSIEGTLSHVGEGAFSGALYLKSVKLSDTMDTISFSAFSGCTSLSGISIPKGIKTIEENAFKDCASLSTIILPDSVEAIEDSAFHGCEAIKTVFFMGNADDMENIDIAEENDGLLDAKIYSYSEEAPKDGSEAWHFDENGKPRIW